MATSSSFIQSATIQSAAVALSTKGEDNNTAATGAVPESRDTDGSLDFDYLTPNGSPTGLEPNTNPAGWLDNHRRVPPHLAPARNPAWDEIRGDAVGVKLFMWTMYGGCQLLQFGYAIPRALNFHAKGLLMYKIANEW